MKILRIVILLLAVMSAGWMVFDGGKALITGDYVTPSSGRFAGQLGPWSRVVESVGIAPRSTLMKCIFVVYGLAWLVAIAGFARRRPWGWSAMLAAAVCSLWYLGAGAVTSAVQIVLLLILRRRGRR